MGHYTKLAVTGVRAVGVLMFVYGVPMVLWAFATSGAGDPARQAGARSAAMAWGVYAVLGGILYRWSVPFARLIARGLDEPEHPDLRPNDR